MTDHTHDLERVFSHRAFIPFVTCGDPDIETTEGLVRAMAEAGADLIELGIPFSDPIAEGPVIQGADVRALSSGVTTDDIFDMAERVRADLDVPMLVMTYINPVFVYGPDRFLERCAGRGYARSSSRTCRTSRSRTSSRTAQSTASNSSP